MFVVLNHMFQALNPVQFGFQAPPEVSEQQLNLNRGVMMLMWKPMDEATARQFAEFLAKQQINQTFHIAEVKDTVKTDPPIQWESGKTAK